MSDDKATSLVLEERDLHASVHVGEPIEVQVPAKGATGNVWEAVVDSERVRIISHTKNPSEESFGGGGTEVFVLQPLTAGVSKVVFRLGAPWRKRPEEEYELSLEATAQPEE